MPNVKVLSLRVNMRVHLQRNLRAEDFPNILVDIGDGKSLEEEGRINVPGNLCDVVGDLISFSDRIYPVSYTHLDVYKRQVLTLMT